MFRQSDGFEELCQPFWETEVLSGSPHQTFWVMKTLCCKLTGVVGVVIQQTFTGCQPACQELNLKDKGDAVPVLQEFTVSASSSVKVNCEFLTSKAAAGIKWERCQDWQPARDTQNGKLFFVVIIQSLSGLQMTAQHPNIWGSEWIPEFSVYIRVCECVCACMHVEHWEEKDTSVSSRDSQSWPYWHFRLDEPLLGCLEHWGVVSGNPILYWLDSNNIAPHRSIVPSRTISRHCQVSSGRGRTHAKVENHCSTQWSLTPLVASQIHHREGDDN